MRWRQGVEIEKERLKQSRNLKEVHTHTHRGIETETETGRLERGSQREGGVDIFGKRGCSAHGMS